MMLVKPVAAAQPFPGSPYIKESLIATLRTLGLTSGLKLCHDHGDLACDAAGQTLTDLSAQATPFFVGADVSATTSDPAFNGSAGALTSAEFRSFDGGDYNRHNGATEAWINNLHKDGAKFTAAVWMYPIAGANNAFFGNCGTTATDIGIRIHCAPTSGVIVCVVLNGSGSAAANVSRNQGVTTATWQFLAASADETAAVIRFVRNDASGTTAFTYTSPSASDATYVMDIGSMGNAVQPMPSTSRLAMIAIWEGVTLTAGQLNLIYQRTRRRFGV